MGRIKQKVMVWITACVIAVGLFAENGMEVKAQGMSIDFNTADADLEKMVLMNLCQETGLLLR